MRLNEADNVCLFRAKYAECLMRSKIAPDMLCHSQESLIKIAKFVFLEKPKNAGIVSLFTFLFCTHSVTSPGLC